MRRTLSLAQTGRALAKLVAIVVLGGGAGMGFGAALADLTKDPATISGAPAPPTAAGRSSAAAPAVATASSLESPTPGARPPAGATVRVRVLSAVLHPAATAAGKRRRRARVSVHVSLSNAGTASVAPAGPRLLDARAVIQGRAVDAAGLVLRGDLAPRAVSERWLRFETAGAVTQRIVKSHQVRVRVADATVTARVRTVGRVRATRHDSR